MQVAFTADFFPLLLAAENETIRQHFLQNTDGEARGWIVEISFCWRFDVCNKYLK